MVKATRCHFFSTAAFCLLLAGPGGAAEVAPPHLVSVEWLDEHLKTGDVLLLDASPAPMYGAQHIPGAVNADLFAYGGRDFSTADMERRLQSWGVSPGRKIVLYDQGAPMMAARIFFDLYYHGVPAENLFLLDGGFAKWQASGKAVTKEAGPPPPKGTFRITKIRDDARVRLPEFLTGTGDLKGHALVEALDANWHFGEVAFFNRPGHIPNGIMLPSADFYRPDKTFKSPDEIRKMLDYLGIKPEQQIYTYCGGGVAASVPFFALKFILNYPNVKLFKESELGWLQDPRDLPYWTYDAPNLLRDASWIRAWGGKAMRMYGISRISVLDVRPPEAFQQGHVPFALNIPAGTFRDHLAQPAKLASLLGPAGVDAAYEAVVVSGAGLTKDAALAFLLLEHLGQRQVSILMDPLDTWEPRGLALTKEATVVGTGKAPQDMTVLPTDYPVNLRHQVLISDPKATHGIYPKVFIASGANLPNQRLDGKVIHVPYGDLLNADGTPKAAKDIWKTLSKAGVPRYAEILCFSDDPAEAAVNYVIFKLMGFPDVKVWVM